MQQRVAELILVSLLWKMFSVVDSVSSVFKNTKSKKIQMLPQKALGGTEWLDWRMRYDVRSVIALLPIQGVFSRLALLWKVCLGDAEVYRGERRGAVAGESGVACDSAFALVQVGFSLQILAVLSSWWSLLRSRAYKYRQKNFYVPKFLRKPKNQA